MQPSSFILHISLLYHLRFQIELSVACSLFFHHVSNLPNLARVLNKPKDWACCWCTMTLRVKLLNYLKYEKKTKKQLKYRKKIISRLAQVCTNPTKFIGSRITGAIPSKTLKLNLTQLSLSSQETEHEVLFLMGHFHLQFIFIFCRRLSMWHSMRESVVQRN